MLAGAWGVVGYLGSKAASDAIIALMPPHDTYIELFVGSGVVLRRKPPAARLFAVDLDGDVLRALPEYPGSPRAAWRGFGQAKACSCPS